MIANHLFGTCRASFAVRTVLSAFTFACVASIACIPCHAKEWKGRNVVFVTSQGRLDPKLMSKWVERLDGGWDVYADLTGRKPKLNIHRYGKAIIEAVPDEQMEVKRAAGLGYVGCTGVQIMMFYKTNYPNLEKDPESMPHYVFYEMGRNFYTFEDRHSCFTCGFSVFMRYVCMDALDCRDLDPHERKAIELAESLHAKGTMGFLKCFTNANGLSEKEPRLKKNNGEGLHPSDQPVMYASAMLRLRRECGGDAWVKRFFAELARCPESNPNTRTGALAQCWYWYLCSSVAARRDLADVFCDKWRMPLDDSTRQALKQVAWDSPNTHAADLARKIKPQWKPDQPAVATPMAAPASPNIPEVEQLRCAKRDYKVEAERMLGEKDRAVLHDFFWEWSLMDLRGFAEWVRQMPLEKMGAVSGLVASVWAEKDPVAAGQWALQWPEGELRCNLCGFVAATWARNDPLAALQWALQLPEGPNAMTDARNVFLKIRETALFQVIGQWAHKDPEAAAQWIEQQPEGEFRAQMLLVVGRCLSAKDPVKAVAWVESLTGQNKDELNRVVIEPQVASLVQKENDFQVVLATVNELPSSLRSIGLREMAKGWSMKRDPESLRALDDWLSAQPSKELQAQCVAAMMSCGRSDPSESYYFFRLKWLSRELERERNGVVWLSLEDHFRDLKKLSPQAAAKWLEEAPLSEEHKAKLRESLE
jgi:hypothetical protein